MRAIGLTIGALILLSVGALMWCEQRWRATTNRLVETLGRQAAPVPMPPFQRSEIADLPTPVRRYFERALTDGQQRASHAVVEQRGTFLVRAPQGWRPFRATQRFATVPQGFVWDARIRLIPGLSIRVRDGFVAGAGSMVASIAGAISLTSVHGTEDIASGSLQRYLAEAVLIPTALLPRGGVVWTPIDDSTSRATLRVSATTVSLDFHFDDEGFVQSVFTAARSRDVDGRPVPTPWQGRWWGYEAHDGMRIPSRGEVEWLLPEGPQIYWRGEMESVSYTYR